MAYDLTGVKMRPFKFEGDALTLAIVWDDFGEGYNLGLFRQDAAGNWSLLPNPEPGRGGWVREALNSAKLSAAGNGSIHAWFEEVLAKDVPAILAYHYGAVKPPDLAATPDYFQKVVKAQYDIAVGDLYFEGGMVKVKPPPLSHNFLTPGMEAGDDR